MGISFVSLSVYDAQIREVTNSLKNEENGDGKRIKGIKRKRIKKETVRRGNRRRDGEESKPFLEIICHRLSSLTKKFFTFLLSFLLFSSYLSNIPSHFGLFL